MIIIIGKILGGGSWVSLGGGGGGSWVSFEEAL